VDVLIVGPATSVGVDFAGTIPEVRAFIALMADVRTLSGRPIAIVLVHHENRAGRVSGAWEGACDTLMHVQPQGHGKLRLYFQKARWSSEHHQTALQLTWADGDTFTVAEDEPDRPERTWSDIEEYVLAHGGCGWNEVAANVSGQRDYLARRRDQMLSAGVLINAGSRGRFKLWHRDDPARPTLDTTDSGVGTGWESSDSATGDGGGTTNGSPVPVRSREPGTEPVGSTSPAEPERADAATIRQERES
jgi:hypothetical protein